MTEPTQTGAVPPSAARAPEPVPHALTPARLKMLRRLVPTLLILGAILLVVFEATITLLLGVVFLLSAVVVAVGMIAEPGFLAADADAAQSDQPPA